MRRLWTTAAVAALCAFAADAWAGPQSQYLELVAAKHLRGAQATETSGRHHGRRKAASVSKSRKTVSKKVRGRRGVKIEKSSEAPARGRRGRHHAAEPATAEPHTARGRRHGAAVRSEIRTEAAPAVKVGRHDTLDSIARRTGVEASELARLNGLKRPYHVRLGARIKLPARRYYVVKSGDTLYTLSHKFGAGESELRAANAGGLGRHLRAGQKLFLPGDAIEAPPPREEAPPARPPRRTPTPFYQQISPVPYTPPQQQPEPTAPPSATPYPRPNTIPQGPSPLSAPPAQAGQGFELAPRPNPYQPTPTPSPGGRQIIQTTPPPSAADISAAGRGRFVWPVQGSLISGFGSKADGQRNDGLNIAANPGDPIRAASDGEVVYAGDQVPSFGNLVLIKHPGGWVTAYAHMGRILVKNRDPVVQGQQIGVVGQTGSVDRPQLHFEIRYAASPKDKAAPVDPSLLLPQR